jgi:CheY-like chemotaxis protein
LNESSTLPAKTSPRVPVLVVEDDREQREALCAMLDVEGFGHEEATNGREALDYLDAFRAPCLILLDIEMPVMNGLAFRVIQLADERLARIPVVVLTANDRSEDARFPGVAGFLSKPLAFAELVVHLDRVCSRSGTVLAGVTPVAA